MKQMYVNAAPQKTTIAGDRIARWRQAIGASKPAEVLLRQVNSTWDEQLFLVERI